MKKLILLTLFFLMIVSCETENNWDELIEEIATEELNDEALMTRSLSYVLDGPQIVFVGDTVEYRFYDFESHFCKNWQYTNFDILKKCGRRLLSDGAYIQRFVVQPINLEYLDLSMGDYIEYKADNKVDLCKEITIRVYKKNFSVKGNDVANVGANYYFTDINLPDSYRIHWYVSSSVERTYSNNNKTALFSFPSVGTYRIECALIRNSEIEYSVVKNVKCINPPTLIGPDNLVEGSWGNFRLDWGGFLPGNDYMFEWNGYFLDIEPSEIGMSAAVRAFDGGGDSSVDVTIKGKNNGYQARVFKTFYVTETTGNWGRFMVTVYNGSRNDLNFTLHNANIKNKLVPAGSTGEFASHVTPGAYQFMVDCTSQPESHFVFDKMYFDGYITTLGAALTVEVENPGIRVINFHNNNFNYPGVYRWFFEEGTGY